MDKRKITPKIFIGGQPNEADLDRLKEEGFRTIINLRTTDEEGYFADEEHAIENRGLNYVEIPTSPELLDDLAIHRFFNALNSDDASPTYVHCAGGGRAGVLTLVFLAVKNGWTLDKAYTMGEELKIAPKKSSPYQAFFESYIRRHSAGERK